MRPDLPQVFFIAGFDPFGLRNNLRLLTQEISALHPSVTVTRLPREGYSVQRLISYGHQNTTDKPVDLFVLHFLSWDDIVREYWTRSKISILLCAVDMYLHLLVSPRLYSIAWQSPKSIFTIFWPAIYFFVALLSSGLLFMLTVLICRIGDLSQSFSFVLALFFTLFTIRQFSRDSARRRIGWLFRAVFFSFNLTPDSSQALKQRLSGFTSYVSSVAVRNPSAKLHIVGHSVGAYLSLITYRNLKQNPLLSRVTLTTLGQNPVFWLTLARHQSQVLHLFKDLSDLTVDWSDLSSHDDWLSFCGLPLSDFLPASFTFDPDYINLDLAQSAGISKLLSSTLSHQFFLHYQYMRSGATSSNLAHWLPISDLHRSIETNSCDEKSN